METINERPICHRAEDLVTYLYGEAAAEEAQDFATHLQRCDACRSEYNLFSQVHDSIVSWRSEVLGPISVREGVADPVAKSAVTTVFAPQPRRLSARGALRQFFTVSPVWLRGAAALAAVALCALIVFTALRLSRKPTPVVNGGINWAVQAEVDKRIAGQLAQQRVKNGSQVTASEVNIKKPRIQLAVNRVRPNTERTRLSAKEREQLAADLGLIPGRDEEAPFVLPDQPNP